MLPRRIAFKLKQKNIFCQLLLNFFQNSQIALSALVQSMEELGKVAIVRRVYNRNSSVCIGALSPRMKLHYEVNAD